MELFNRVFAVVMVISIVTGALVGLILAEIYL